MAMLLNSSKLAYQQPNNEAPKVHGISNKSSIGLQGTLYNQLNGIISGPVVELKQRSRASND